MNKTSLFLSQSYQDAWDDYIRVLNNPSFAHWDYIILTASNRVQAKGYEAQIEERRKNGLLPVNTHFAVIPDENEERIGSGGATLSVIKYIMAHSGKSDFSGMRTLVIHSGGDSKRVPQYSAVGKLFSAVPHQLQNGRMSTLFDELLITMSAMASCIQEGMLLLSGDVLLLFNPLQIDYSGREAACISFKEPALKGKNHGVFVEGKDGKVAKFLHKQSVEKLYEYGAVNEQGNVNIDTGAVVLTKDILNSLYSLIATNGKLDEIKYRQFVNAKVRLSLYADFLYPLASDSNLEDFYKEEPEGEFCDELREARKIVWEKLGGYNAKLICVAPAKFIHFGTTREVLDMMTEGVNAYETLGWCKQNKSSVQHECVAYNSVLDESVCVGHKVYLENSYVSDDARIGDDVVLADVEVKHVEIPSDVVVHALKQTDGRFVVRIYGVDDNPKGNHLFGKNIDEVVVEYGLNENDIWDTKEHTLWNARLYPVSESVESGLHAALNLYEVVHGDGNIAAWLQSVRKSLQSGFGEADCNAIISWNKKLQEIVCMEKVLQLIKKEKSVDEVKAILKDGILTDTQKKWLEEKLDTVSSSEKMRLDYYIGQALGGKNGDVFTSRCFKRISTRLQDEISDEIVYNDTCRIVKDSHTVTLPLRVNWGGGWSDTPPYCIEKGGTVLNASILLSGKKPVEVTLKQISENKIVFDSRDMDVHGEFDDIADLQRTGDPFDPFALQKAALLACGIIPRKGGKLNDILARLGGGFIMHSEVRNVPKGSGLGTSSILAAACAKCLLDFVGIPYSNSKIYRLVLIMEQIMSTGGGWQDQVGGLTNGIKYISSKPGWKQELTVSEVHIADTTRRELNERLVLIYTGQRRLARNLLRDVVGRYVGCVPETVEALNEIQKIAVLMRFELERGNVDEFAKLMNRHWELSKTIDGGTSNTLIEQIFATIEEYIEGKFICGAGGGGFLQVILKQGVTKLDVQNRLKEVFQDSAVAVWDSTLI